MADSSSASSSGSYTDVDMREIMEWQVEVMKSFNVKELDELLNLKGKSVKGLKAQKAMEVSWCYTKEEIKEWRRNTRQTDMTSPALLVKRQRTDQTTLDKFFRK